MQRKTKLKFFDQFSTIHIISLPERRDRRALMNKGFDIRGINMLDNRITYFDAIKPNKANNFSNVGTYGCYLSHLEVLKMAIRKSSPKILVFEDDILLCKRFLGIEYQLAKGMENTDWDIIYFSHGIKNKIFTHGFNLFYEGVTTLGMYAIKLDAARRIVKYIEDDVEKRDANNQHQIEIDGLFNHFRENNQDIKTLVFYPSIGIQCGSFSDLHLKKFERTPIVSYVITILRWMKRLVLERVF